MTLNSQLHHIATADAVAAPGAAEPTTEAAPLPVGTSVEVRSRFDRRWSRGFAIAAVARDAYQLRRVSDGAVLPAWFATEEIRRTVAMR